MMRESLFLYEGHVHCERALYHHLLSDLSTPCRAYADLRGFLLRKFMSREFRHDARPVPGLAVLKERHESQ